MLLLHIADLINRITNDSLDELASTDLRTLHAIWDLLCKMPIRGVNPHVPLIEC